MGCKSYQAHKWTDQMSNKIAENNTIEITVSAEITENNKTKTEITENNPTEITKNNKTKITETKTMSSAGVENKTINSWQQVRRRFHLKKTSLKEAINNEEIKTDIQTIFHEFGSMKKAFVAAASPGRKRKAAPTNLLEVERVHYQYVDLSVDLAFNDIINDKDGLIYSQPKDKEDEPSTESDKIIEVIIKSHNSSEVTAKIRVEDEDNSKEDKGNGEDGKNSDKVELLQNTENKRQKLLNTNENRSRTSVENMEVLNKDARQKLVEMF